MADKPLSQFGTIPDTSSLESFETTMPAAPERAPDQADADRVTEELIGRPMPTPTPPAPAPGYAAWNTDPYAKPGDEEKNALGWKPGDTRSGIKRIYDALSPETASSSLDWSRYQ